MELGRFGEAEGMLMNVARAPDSHCPNPLYSQGLKLHSTSPAQPFGLSKQEEAVLNFRVGEVAAPWSTHTIISSLKAFYQ